MAKRLGLAVQERKLIITPAGTRTQIYGSGGRRSIQLNYGRGESRR
jgi:hypothetical protein